MADFIPAVEKGGMVFMPFIKCVGESGQGCQLKGLVLAGHGDRCLLHGGESFNGTTPAAGDHPPDIGKLPQLSDWPEPKKPGRARGKERRRRGRRK